MKTKLLVLSLMFTITLNAQQTTTTILNTNQNQTTILTFSNEGYFLTYPQQQTTVILNQQPVLNNVENNRYFLNYPRLENTTILNQPITPYFLEVPTIRLETPINSDLCVPVLQPLNNKKDEERNNN